jgi:hypothetical protein
MTVARQQGTHCLEHHRYDTPNILLHPSLWLQMEYLLSGKKDTEMISNYKMYKNICIESHFRSFFLWG